MKFTNNALGIQDFEIIRENKIFYVDKTDAELISRGIGKDNIYHFRFAFQGKEVLIKG